MIIHSCKNKLLLGYSQRRFKNIKTAFFNTKELHMMSVPHLLWFFNPKLTFFHINTAFLINRGYKKPVAKTFSSNQVFQQNLVNSQYILHVIVALKRRWKLGNFKCWIFFLKVISTSPCKCWYRLNQRLQLQVHFHLCLLKKNCVVSLDYHQLYQTMHHHNFHL